MGGGYGCGTSRDDAQPTHRRVEGANAASASDAARRRAGHARRQVPPAPSPHRSPLPGSGPARRGPARPSGVRCSSDGSAPFPFRRRAGPPTRRARPGGARRAAGRRRRRRRRAPRRAAALPAAGGDRGRRARLRRRLPRRHALRRQVQPRAARAARGVGRRRAPLRLRLPGRDPPRPPDVPRGGDPLHAPGQGARRDPRRLAAGRARLRARFAGRARQDPRGDAGARAAISGCSSASPSPATPRPTR